MLVTDLLLSNEWLNRLAGFDRLLLAYSGGLDSTVLLQLLANEPALRSKLLLLHINHGISPNAQAWQAHCQAQARALQLPFFAESLQLDLSNNIEEKARKARYAVFAQYLQPKDCLLLGHHQNDQAETLLLQLFRGAGIDGLAAMMDFMPWDKAWLARPLFDYSRQVLLQYAEQRRLLWIEDESNQDSAYTRNYLRQEVMPLLLKQWPGLVSTLARTAEHAQQARHNLNTLALLDCTALRQTSPQLAIEALLPLDDDRLSNVLRYWLKQHALQMPSTRTFLRLIQELIRGREDAQPLVTWSGVRLRRYRHTLYLETTAKPALPESLAWSDFPKPLTLANAAITLNALPSDSGFSLPPGAVLTVAFRQGGERMRWRNQNKSLKKLMQEWGIPPWLRDRIPLLYVDNQLAVVVGYALSDLFFTAEPGKAYLIAQDFFAGDSVV